WQYFAGRNGTAGYQSSPRQLAGTSPRQRRGFYPPAGVNPAHQAAGMDRAIISQKLESLRRCIARLESRRPSSAEQLKADLDLQDIVALNLTRAVQLSVDIAAHWLAEHAEVASPQTMGQTFSLLAECGVIDEDLARRLRKSVGFRNIV